MQQIEFLIQNHNINYFWVGGYGEFDRMASRAIRELKKSYPHICLQLVLAYLPQKNKSELTYLYQLYDDLVYPEGLEIIPQRFAIVKRNQYMIANSDIIITYVNNESGGAYQALQHAQKMKKNVINLTQ